MFTEDDLRATLRGLEDETPDADRVMAGLDRVRRRHTVRRRTFGVAAAAVLAAAVTGGSILVAAPDRSTEEGTPPPDSRLARLRFPFAVDTIAGYRVGMRFLNVNGTSVAWIDTPDHISRGNLDPYELHVFQKGRFDPAAERVGEPIQVNGKAGFYRVDSLCQCGTDVGTPGVVWEYAPDSWALVRFTRSSSAAPAEVREILLTIATAVRFDRTTPVPMPFRIGYVPAGLRPAVPGTARVNTFVQGSLGATVVLETPDDRKLTVIGTEQRGGDIPVGEPYVASSLGTLVVEVNLGQLIVQLSGARDYSVTELKKVARSIRPAKDLYDLRTWFDADRAITVH